MISFQSDRNYYLECRNKGADSYKLLVHITDETSASISWKQIACMSLFYNRSQAGTITWYGSDPYQTVVPPAKISKNTRAGVYKTLCPQQLASTSK